MSEFLDPNTVSNSDEQYRLHMERYAWARAAIKGPIVANAACSCNYGYEILKTPGRLVIGFDRNKSALDLARSRGLNMFIEKDIQGETFDGFTSLVCLETFEHLQSPWEFLGGLSSTIKEIVLSTPIIPTKHFNEWHLHDFTEDEVKNGMQSLGWNIEQVKYQDEQMLSKPTYIWIYATKR